MRIPQWGRLTRKICEVLSCDQTATHWVEDGEGSDSEYCYEHAERFYRAAERKYAKVTAKN